MVRGVRSFFTSGLNKKKQKAKKTSSIQMDVQTDLNGIDVLTRCGLTEILQVVIEFSVLSRIDSLYHTVTLVEKQALY